MEQISTFPHNAMPLPWAGTARSEQSGAGGNSVQQILGLLREVGFRPCRVPHLGDQIGMWAPSDAIYADRDYLLKRDVRRMILRVIKSLGNLGVEQVDFYVGKSDPRCFQRAQLLDHHLPLRVSGTRTYIGVMNGTDGLLISA